jgi:dynamin 1-like protein
MERVLDKCLTPTTEMIVSLIEIENAHINTNHPDFVGSADSILNLFATDAETENETEKNFSLIKSKQPKEVSSPGQDAQVFNDNGSEEETKRSETGYFSNMFGGKMDTTSKKTKKDETMD